MLNLYNITNSVRRRLLANRQKNRRIKSAYTPSLIFCREDTWREPRWSIVSHIIPYYFNSWGTGSHLYTANANTLRSVHWVEDLLALVGTHISWSPHPPLLYPYCITTWAVCQGVFRNFLKFLFNQHHSLDRCVPPCGLPCNWGISSVIPS